MYCRKCLKDKKEVKVNMNVDLKAKTYGCPKCNHKVKWDNNPLN